MSSKPKSTRQTVISSVIIGFFIASALLTIFVPTDDEKTDNTDIEQVETQQQNAPKSGPIGINDIKTSQSNEQQVTPDQPVIVSEPVEGDPYEELNELIGLESVKEEVKSLANFVKVQQQRKEHGMKTSSVSYHCVFTGSPGTGKTTIARILARIYRDLGVVQKGHLVETDRSGLIAEYVGQTAVKTNALIDSALGGVLFIDEAYALLDGKGGYGDEAIATLLKRMEDDRDRLVVIVAGYTNEMKNFIESNPGLQSRFTRYIEFPDYTAPELYDIFMMRVNKYNYKLTAEADEYLKEKLEYTVEHKSRNFGNARYVRNLFEKAITLQANRLGNIKNPTEEQLAELNLADITGACESVKK